jgi:ADP-heptose:LPS heptosyltransferase
MNTEHLLIMRFSALGDVAMTVPVVYSLAQQYPNIRITMLSKPFARPFFENLAPNVSFMAADINNEYHGVRGLNALYRRLTAKNFTAVADFHSVLRSEYLRMRFNFDHYRVESIDKHRNGKSKLVAENNKELKQQPTSFQNYADVLAKLGYPVKLEFKSIFTPEGGNLRLLSEKIGEKRPFQQWVGIAPFAAHAGKMYPLPQMRKVINIIVANHPSSRIFLFGGGDNEMQLLDEISSGSKQIINASRSLDGMIQELILMSHLDVMISMDSANMHLASLVNTPVVSIWGATHPFAGFMGWNQSMDNVVQIDLPCRPCSIYGNKPCLRGDWACMHNISPEMVSEHIERILQAK